MIWTPEIFAGFVSAGGVSLYGLKRLGILNLDWRRNSNPADSPKNYSVAIETLEEKSTVAEVKIAEHEKRLDKLDKAFEKMAGEVSTININVGILLDRTKK